MTSEPTPLAGKYLLLKRLARGGMAEVFLAKQTGRGGFEKLVVVKRILPHLAGSESFKTMFLDEARTAALIGHPNVVDILEVGEDEGQLFMVLEYLRGQDASRLLVRSIEAGERVPLQVALQIVVDAGTGLHHAHEKADLADRPLQIVHRDVSPQNIFVTYDGVTKLLDFGIARARGKLAQTEAGQLKGKVCYMSPEQARGQDLDRRSDLFSLGIVLYELTTGVGLFHEHNETASLEAVFRCDVPAPRSFLPDYPAGLEAIVLKALSKERDARYATCDEFASALEDFAAGAGLALSAKRLGQHMKSVFADELKRPLMGGDDDEAKKPDPDANTALLPKGGDRFNRVALPTSATRRMKPITGAGGHTLAGAPMAIAAPPAIPSEEEAVGNVGRATFGDDDDDEFAPPTETTMIDGPIATDDADSPLPTQGGGAVPEFFGDDNAFEVPFTELGPMATQSSAFVGRRAELQAVDDAFAKGKKVVVLKGPPGSGKSRLALEVARGHASDSAPLHIAASGVRSAAALHDVVRQILSLDKDADTAAAIAGRTRLLLLDNLESNAAAISCLSAWFAKAPQLQVLVTARQVLPWPDVVVVEVGPLSVPQPDGSPVEQLESEAVLLLADRARAARGELKKKPDDLRIAVEIARLLDGLPLALEDVAQEIQRSGWAAALTTLCAATEPPFAQGVSIDRSWDLLDPAARTGLAFCSVFRGGFTVADAKGVLDLRGLKDPPPVDVVINGLCARSLVVDDGKGRYDLLRPLRVYAEARLQELELSPNALRRHRAHFVRDGALDAKDAENVLAAFRSALQESPPTQESATALAKSALALATLPSTTTTESLDRFDKVVARAQGLPPLLFARVLGARGRENTHRGHLEQARADFERAIRIVRGDTDRSLEGEFAADLADVLVSAGDVDVARAVVTAAVERGPGEFVRARLRQSEGRLQALRADAETAEQTLKQARAAFEKLGDKVHVGRAAADLARVVAESGDVVRAQGLYEKALLLHADAGDRRGEGASLAALGLLLVQSGDIVRGTAAVEGGLKVLQDVGDKRAEALTQQALAEVARSKGDIKEARTRFTAALQLHRACGANAQAVVVERRLRAL